jgi:hypothetical protein
VCRWRWVNSDIANLILVVGQFLWIELWRLKSGARICKTGVLSEASAGRRIQDGALGFVLSHPFAKNAKGWGTRWHPVEYKWLRNGLVYQILLGKWKVGLEEIKPRNPTAPKRGSGSS